MENKTFDIESGLNIQAQQLIRWKSIMKREVFTALFNHCESLNNLLIDGKGKDVWGKPLPMNGYSVFRGVDMDNWIHNNLMKR